MDTNNTIDNLVEEIFFKKAKDFFNSDVKGEFSQLSNYLNTETEKNILRCIDEIKNELEDTSDEVLEKFDDDFFSPLNSNIHNGLEKIKEESLLQLKEVQANILAAKQSNDEQFNALQTHVDLQFNKGKEWLEIGFINQEKQSRGRYDYIVSTLEQNIKNKINDLEKEISELKENYPSEKEMLLLHISDKSNVVLGRAKYNSIYLVILVILNLLTLAFLVFDKLNLLV